MLGRTREPFLVGRVAVLGLASRTASLCEEGPVGTDEVVLELGEERLRGGQVLVSQMAGSDVDGDSPATASVANIPRKSWAVNFSGSPAASRNPVRQVVRLARFRASAAGSPCQPGASIKAAT